MGGSYRRSGGRRSGNRSAFAGGSRTQPEFVESQRIDFSGRTDAVGFLKLFHRIDGGVVPLPRRLSIKIALSVQSSLNLSDAVGCGSLLTMRGGFNLLLGLGALFLLDGRLRGSRTSGGRDNRGRAHQQHGPKGTEPDFPSHRFSWWAPRFT